MKMRTKLITIALLVLTLVFSVSVTQATWITNNTYYEDFNDQDEGTPENPLVPWYAFTNEGFTTAGVNNTLKDGAKVFYIHDVNGDGAALAYANFTVEDDYNDDPITSFSFHFIANAENLTKKEFGMQGSLLDGYVPILCGTTANSTDMWIGVSDSVSDNGSISADTEYILTWTFDWSTGVVNGTITNLTGTLIASCEDPLALMTGDNVTVTTASGLQDISIFSNDNSSFLLDNVEWSTAHWVTQVSDSIDTVVALAYTMITVFVVLGLLSIGFSKFKW